MPKGDRVILKADPEDGTTPISNLLLEAVAIAKLTAREIRAILWLWRRTYGWQKNGGRLKEAIIPLSEWARVLDTDSSHASTVLSLLASKKIFTRIFIGPGKGYHYSMNTRVTEWGNGCINQQRLQEIVREGLPKTVTVPLPKTVTPSDTNLAMPKERLKKIKESTPKKGDKPSHSPNGISEIFEEMRDHLGYPGKVDKDPIPSYGKEGTAIKRMLARGFSHEEIMTCWKGKVDQRGEYVSMTWINEDIGKSGKGGRRTRELPTVYTPQREYPEDDESDKYIQGKRGKNVRR